MTSEELLEALNKRFDSIDKRLDFLEEIIEEMKEDAEITRDGVNSLLSWAEECGNVIKFPLPQIAK